MGNENEQKNENKEEELKDEEIVAFVKEVGIDQFKEWKNSFEEVEEEEEGEGEEKKDAPFSDEQIKLITTIISKAMDERVPKPEKKKLQKKSTEKKSAQRSNPVATPINRMGNDQFGYI